MTEDDNTILVRVDKTTKMASVRHIKTGKGMAGNYWDFRNEVHGMYDLPNFHGFGHLAEILSKKYNAPIVVVNADWDHTTNWFKEPDKV